MNEEEHYSPNLVLQGPDTNTPMTFNSCLLIIRDDLNCWPRNIGWVNIKWCFLQWCNLFSSSFANFYLFFWREAVRVDGGYAIRMTTQVTSYIQTLLWFYSFIASNGAQTACSITVKANICHCHIRKSLAITQLQPMIKISRFKSNGNENSMPKGGIHLSLCSKYCYLCFIIFLAPKYLGGKDSFISFLNR